ncbi:MAG: hypothetical protein E7182_06010 [Erysipelotrichaceae bacterium]|nr:hypothetical protein [Erysipelotrichaceae bacterium]
MIPIHYTKLTVLDDRIVYSDGGRLLVRLSDVWAIGYKKPGFMNWLSMKYDWMAMGVLYIAPKTARKVQDLIPVIMPYEVVKELPKRWAQKTEFYEFGGDIKIKRLIDVL